MFWRPIHFSIVKRLFPEFEVLLTPFVIQLTILSLFKNFQPIDHSKNRKNKEINVPGVIV